MTNPEKTKTPIPSFRSLKAQGARVTMITVYDYPFARLVDCSPAEMILVGDSLGMVIQGLEQTNPVTLEEVIYHLKAVRRGAPHTLVVADMPFMSYQVSPEQAVTNAGRMIKEGGADCVKLEGGEYFADYVHRIVKAGIPVIGHIGLTPQSSSALGGFKVQGKTPEEAEQLLADARALDEAGAFAMVLGVHPGRRGQGHHGLRQGEHHRLRRRAARRRPEPQRLRYPGAVRSLRAQVRQAVPEARAGYRGTFDAFAARCSLGQLPGPRSTASRAASASSSFYPEE